MGAFLKEDKIAREYIGGTRSDDRVEGEPRGSSSRAATECGRLPWCGWLGRHAALFALLVLAVSGVLLFSAFAGPARAFTVSTFAGDSGDWGSADGPGRAARFNLPSGICYDSANGNLYVVDTENQTIRKVTRTGVVTTLAGSPGQVGSADGTGSAARFNDPRGICYDSANGNLYVTDSKNATIRQVTPAGVVTTLAGSPGKQASADGPGSAARFNLPSGICYDSANGNLYVTDYANHTVRQVTPAGLVTTLAGSPGDAGSADGTGSAARFNWPRGICYNSADGNLYVADVSNSTIRQVTPIGVVTSIAGSPGEQGNVDGTGSAAQFVYPMGICYNSADGNLYVTDSLGSTIRQVTPAGVVTTIAGNPESYGSADGTGSAARFNDPRGICYDSANGNLYVVDTYNHSIRLVSLTEPPDFSDIASSPYRAAILDLASLRVISGFPDGTFRPESPVTRQQFAKMIVESLGLPVSLGDISPFADVGSNLDPTDPLYPDHYVAVCFAYGITEGTTPATFAPYANMSRAQLITMVARAANLPEPPADYVPSFGRFSRTHYAWARKAAHAGLLDGLEGMGPGYAFFDSATRGEVCVLLYNLLRR